MVGFSDLFKKNKIKDRIKVYIVSTDQKEIVDLVNSLAGKLPKNQYALLTFSSYDDAMANYSACLVKAEEIADEHEKTILPRTHMTAPPIIQRPLVVIMGADGESGFRAARLADIIRSDNQSKKVLELHQTERFRLCSASDDSVPDDIKNPGKLFSAKIIYEHENPDSYKKSLITTAKSVDSYIKKVGPTLNGGLGNSL